MRDAGNDLRLELGDQRVVRLPLCSRACGESRLHFAWFYTGQDVETIDTVEIVGDPVDEAMARGAEFIAARIELRHPAILLRGPPYSQASV